MQRINVDFKDLFSKDSLQKVKDLLKIEGQKVKEFIEKIDEKSAKEINEFADKVDNVGDTVASAIDKLSDYIKENTSTQCELIRTKELDMSELKKILSETMTEESHFAALLDLGRNKKDELEIFLQYLDKDKKQIDMKKVYCIRCDMKSDELKQAFGDKELLIINL